MSREKRGAGERGAWHIHIFYPTAFPPLTPQVSVIDKLLSGTRDIRLQTAGLKVLGRAAGEADEKQAASVPQMLATEISVCQFPMTPTTLCHQIVPNGNNTAIQLTHDLECT